MNLTGQSLGYQQITSLTASTALTVPTGASQALIQAESQDVRFRDDGTAPTSSVGVVLAAGASMNVSGAALLQLRFIETTASAKLNILYYT